MVCSFPPACLVLEVELLGPLRSPSGVLEVQATFEDLRPGMTGLPTWGISGLPRR